MNIEERSSIYGDNSFHRILKTDIKNPNNQEDEIIFGCGCFWGLKNVLETSWSCYYFRRLCWWR